MAWWARPHRTTARSVDVFPGTCPGTQASRSGDSVGWAYTRTSGHRKDDLTDLTATDEIVEDSELPSLVANATSHDRRMHSNLLGECNHRSFISQAVNLAA